jgi:hypothetical protein
MAGYFGMVASARPPWVGEGIALDGSLGLDVLRAENKTMQVGLGFRVDTGVAVSKSCTKIFFLGTGAEVFYEQRDGKSHLTGVGGSLPFLKARVMFGGVKTDGEAQLADGGDAQRDGDQSDDSPFEVRLHGANPNADGVDIDASWDEVQKGVGVAAYSGERKPRRKLDLD